MTTVPGPLESHDTHAVDRHALQLHDAALMQLSPDTLARLRRGRQAATAAAPRRRPLPSSWLAGGAMAAALGLAVVLLPGTPAPPGPGPVADAATATPDLAAAEADPAETLQDDPGFYVWLGSLDSNALAME